VLARPLTPRYLNITIGKLDFRPSSRETALAVSPLPRNYTLAGPPPASTSSSRLTLQPCSAPARTVWIIDTVHSPATAAEGYFPLINGSTRNFSRPFVMHYSRNARPTDEQTRQIRVRHLKLLGKERTVPDSCGVPASASCRRRPSFNP
jgi:hypothetical protein